MPSEWHCDEPVFTKSHYDGSTSLRTSRLYEDFLFQSIIFNIAVLVNAHCMQVD